MSEINFKKLKKELLVAIRGRRSQAQLSAKMGFRSNQLFRWESRETNISWTEFCELCRHTNVPLDNAVRTFLYFTAPAHEWQPLLSHLSGSSLQAEVARRAGVSRSTVSRWHTGKIVPSLEQILRLVETGAYSIVEFVSALTDPKLLPTILLERELQKRERELHYRYPWTGALVLAFSCPDYKLLPRHSDEFVARKIGISADQVRHTIAELKAVGAIQPEGPRWKARLRRLSTIGSNVGYQRIRAYWTERCLNRARNFQRPLHLEPGQWPYMLFSLNPESFEKIRVKILELFQEIETLSQASPDANEIYLFNGQLLELSELCSDSQKQILSQRPSLESEASLRH